MEIISHAFHGSRHGPGWSCSTRADGHMGTWAHPGKVKWPPVCDLCLLKKKIPTIERISHGFHGSRHGPGWSCSTWAHRHMGLWAHKNTQGKSKRHSFKKTSWVSEVIDNFSHDGTWAHGLIGRQAHPGKVEATFIQEDKDASAEWVRWCPILRVTLQLSYAILVHPKFGFNEGELGERIGIEWQLDRMRRRGEPILMQGRASWVSELMPKSTSYHPTVVIRNSHSPKIN